MNFVKSILIILKLKFHSFLLKNLKVGIKNYKFSKIEFFLFFQSICLKLTTLINFLISELCNFYFHLSNHEISFISDEIEKVGFKNSKMLWKKRIVLFIQSICVHSNILIEFIINELC